MTKELEIYINEGFTGFVPVSKLRANTSVIPKGGGVYVIIRDNDTAPIFLAEGTGGFFKGDNPNVCIEELKAKYAADSRVLYIGKSIRLKRRIGDLLGFGAGSAVSHWGGRHLWQLADADSLLIAWKPMPVGNPQDEKVRMLREFVNVHGKLPFANRTM